MGNTTGGPALTRYDRQERVRMDLELKLDRQRATSLLQAIGALVGMAGVGGGLAGVASNCSAWSCWVPVLRGAGQAMLAALVGFSVIGAVIAIAHMATRHAPVEQGDGDPFPFARPNRHSTARLPDGVGEIDLWQYLIGIANDASITLSQRGAAEYNFSQTQANGIKDWCINAGWYTMTNTANASGDWTDTGAAVLEMLRQSPPATWNEIIALLPD